MKTFILFLLATCCTFIGRSQDIAFSNVSLQNRNSREIINFTNPHEVNTRQYRIEASNDNVHYEVIATVPSKGNNVFASNYSYDVTPFDYTYFRVGRVDMNGQMPYSAVVKNEKPAKTDQQPTTEANSHHAIANK